MFELELKSLEAKYPVIVEYLPKLKATLTDEKYIHSIGCMVTAYDMMSSFVEGEAPKADAALKADAGSVADEAPEADAAPKADAALLEKAVITGILHDCAKGMKLHELMAICETFGIVKDDVGSMTHSMLHAACGVFVAQRDYGITDFEVLNAIRYHTTGRADMSLLEKIIYLADSFEPARGLVDGAEQISRTKIDIDQVLFEQLELNIRIVIEAGKFLNDDTVRARNFLLHKGPAD